MNLTWPTLSVLALTLATFAAPASAAPASLEGVKGGAPSATEHVAYRRCWYHRGHRHCRYVREGYRYEPGVNLYIGGGRHHHHRHHRH